MKINVKTKIGNVVYDFDVQEQSELETLHKAIVLASPRSTCTQCGTKGYDSKYLTTNKSTTDEGTFTYINCKCAKCGARSGLGQYKAGGYFWKDYEKYEKKEGTQEDNIDPELDS